MVKPKAQETTKENVASKAEEKATKARRKVLNAQDLDEDTKLGSVQHKGKRAGNVRNQIISL